MNPVERAAAELAEALTDTSSEMITQRERMAARSPVLYRLCHNVMMAVVDAKLSQQAARAAAAGVTVVDAPHQVGPARRMDRP